MSRYLPAVGATVAVVALVMGSAGCGPDVLILPPPEVEEDLVHVSVLSSGEPYLVCSVLGPMAFVADESVGEGCVSKQPSWSLGISTPLDNLSYGDVTVAGAAQETSSFHIAPGTEWPLIAWSHSGDREDPDQCPLNESRVSALASNSIRIAVQEPNQSPPPLRRDGMWPSTLVLADGQVGLVWREESRGPDQAVLRLTREDETEVILDEENGLGRFTGTTLDASGRLVVATFDDDDGLWVIRETAEGWRTERIAEDLRPTSRASLVAHASGRVTVVVVPEDRTGVHLYKHPGDEGEDAWTRDVFEPPDGLVSARVSAVISSEDTVLLGYADRDGTRASLALEFLTSWDIAVMPVDGRSCDRVMLSVDGEQTSALLRCELIESDDTGDTDVGEAREHDYFWTEALPVR